MKKWRLKKSVVYGIYALSFVSVMGVIYFLDTSNNEVFKDNTTYVNRIIMDDVVPVVNVSEMIFKPFLDDSVIVAKKYYNSALTEEEQANSLIHYQGTYIPNSGVDYKGDDAFDVVAILDGTVTKITENTLLGKIVEITHNNNLISVYQSLADINVIEGDAVIQGQIIGKTGCANISTDLGNHLHFELILNGKNIDPEKYYGKELKEL